MPADKITNTIFGIPGGIFALAAIVVVCTILLLVRQGGLKKTVTEVEASQPAEVEKKPLFLEEVAAISAVMALYFGETTPPIDFVVAKVTRLSDNASWGQVGQVQNTQSL